MMKKGLWLLLFLIWIEADSELMAQVYTMCQPGSNESVNTCSGSFFDSGGPSGNYTNNNNCSYTFCADQPGQCIMVDFSSFQVNDIFLGVAFDFLDVHDGAPATPANYMFSIAGGPFPAPFPVASATGCLTFVFSSDLFFNDQGWNSAITCQPCPIPSNTSQQDCNGAIPVCEEQYYQPFAYSGNNGSNIVPGGSCLAFGELNNSWYVFTAQNSGNLSFVITPNFSADDYDWAVYDISNGGCSGISSGVSPEVSCNFSADVGTWAGQTGAISGTPYFGFGSNQGEFGSAFNASIPVVAGNTYALVVSNFSASQGGYYLDLSPSTATLFDNSAPLLESLVAPTCGSTQVTVNFSEPTLCSSLQAGDFTLSGPGGPYTITAVNALSCTGAGIQFTQNAVLTVSAPLLQSGNYEVCLSNAAGGISDLCGNTSSVGCANANLSTSIVANAGLDRVICTTGQTVTLGGSPAASGGSGSYTYAWTPAAGIQSGQSSANPVVSPSSNTTYTLVVTDGLGCTASDDVLVSIQTATPLSISYNAPFCVNQNTTQVVNLQGVAGGLYSASPSGLSINAATGAILPSSSTPGTYTVTYTAPAVGACPPQTATNTVQITSLPGAPILSPALPCPGTAIEFVSSGSAWTSFNLNGVEVQAPSSDNSWTSGSVVAGDQVCAISYPVPPFTFNGQITEAEWGAPLATSANGPLSGFGGSNNLDALYLKNMSGYLFGALAGQTQDGSNNRFLLFIDSEPGGFNSLSGWTNRTNAPYFSVENLNSGIQFDPGFEPDYILAMNQAFGIGFFDLYRMASNTSVFLGQTGSSPVLGYQSNGGSGNLLAGYEFGLPLSRLGNPGTSVAVFAMLVNDPGFGIPTFVSNQFITPAGNGENNYGNGAINFGAASPNPVSYFLSADCESQTCVTVTNPVTPNFVTPAPICTGESILPLPTTSGNGIVGSWSPALNNTSTTTYTFTPNAGQCATNQTLTITVNPLPGTGTILHD